jgi:aspartyl-tRNA(Asn)/glutamyl-tRNA(Gln) amidotransferase subunit A
MRSLWRFKSELRRRFAQEVDLLLTPTTPITAPLWSDARDMVETTRRVGRFTYDLGASGIPSMSVPCGFDDARLPIGMQLSAAWGEEGLLFRAGHAYQQEVGDPELPDMHRTGTPR